MATKTGGAGRGDFSMAALAPFRIASVVVLISDTPCCEAGPRISAADLATLHRRPAEAVAHPGHPARSGGVHGQADPARRQSSGEVGSGRAPLPERAIDGFSDYDAGGDFPRPAVAAGLPAPVGMGGWNGGGISVAARPIGREAVFLLQVAHNALSPGEIVAIRDRGPVEPDPQGRDVGVSIVTYGEEGVVSQPGR